MLATLVAVMALVSATSQTATAPSAQEILGLLDEWNLSVFRSAFEEKKIDGYALMVCLLSVSLCFMEQRSMYLWFIDLEHTIMV